MGPLCRLYYSLSPFQAVHFWYFLLICADGRTEDGRTLAPGGPEERNRRFAQKSCHLELTSAIVQNNYGKIIHTVRYCAVRLRSCRYISGKYKVVTAQSRIWKKYQGLVRVLGVPQSLQKRWKWTPSMKNNLSYVPEVRPTPLTLWDMVTLRYSELRFWGPAGSRPDPQNGSKSEKMWGKWICRVLGTKNPFIMVVRCS